MVSRETGVAYQGPSPVLVRRDSVATQLTGTFIVELGVLLRCLNKMSVVGRPVISSGDAAQRSAASRTACSCPPGGRMQGAASSFKRRSRAALGRPSAR